MRRDGSVRPQESRRAVRRPLATSATASKSHGLQCTAATVRLYSSSIVRSSLSTVTTIERSGLPGIYRGILDSARMRPGDVVELRSKYRGRVRWAFPHRVVADDGDRFVLYLAPGTEGVSMGRDADGRYLERWMSDDPPHRHVWRQHHIL